MRLEDTTVRSLEAPEKGQRLYRDDALAGFGCRVSQGGTKTFVLVHGADRRFITIGRYPVISLAKARARAKEMLAEFTLGKGRPQAISYEAAVELFLKDKAQARRPSTVQSYKNKLARLKFKGQLTHINPSEAARQLDKVKRPGERSHVLAAASVFFHWCINRRYLDDNPFRGLHKPPTNRRKRVLADDEIRLFWSATEQPTTFHKILRLSLLTAQRRTELSLIKPEYVDGDVCLLPGSITKNHRDHAVPLSPWAKQFLTFEGYHSWSDGKEELDSRLNIPHWVIQDLRRTARTNFSRLGIAPHISERILNHISHRSPLEDTYDLYHWVPEMRAALDIWQKYLGDILDLAVQRAA